LSLVRLDREKKTRGRISSSKRGELETEEVTRRVGRFHLLSKRSSQIPGKMGKEGRMRKKVGGR